MKNVKWTAQGLFNAFKKEDNVNAFKELYKALLAREIALDEYTEEADIKLDEILDNMYYRNDAIASFIDENLVMDTRNMMQEAGFSIDNWK